MTDTTERTRIFRQALDANVRELSFGSSPTREPQALVILVALVVGAIVGATAALLALALVL